jgi:5-hydroxyisourate hydrolase-like protein (transthyretin family)
LAIETLFAVGNLTRTSRYTRQFPGMADISGRIVEAMKIQRLTLAFLCALLLPVASFAGKKPQAPAEKTASVNVVVVKDANGKPVKNAEVVLHLLDNHGKQMQEGMELKTHDDGKAEATGIPYGRVRVQVIAPGFKTYGQDFSVDQPTLEITIKMQKPAEQFSIYK